MATSSLQSPSSSSSSRLASGRLTVSQARAGAPARWGSAVVEPARKGANHYWKQASNRSQGGRRSTVWIDEVGGHSASMAAGTGAAELGAGGTFTQNRIRYAFELFGACMLIVTFLALAMFV